MSQQKRTRQQQWKTYARRRAKRPTPTFVPPAPIRVKKRVEEWIIENRADLLYQIESCVRKLWTEVEDIDDRWIARLLRLSIEDGNIDDDQLRWGLHRLNAVRNERDDISDETWRDALRVVYGSLQYHSNCEPGECSFLSRISPIIVYVREDSDVAVKVHSGLPNP